VKKVVNKNKKKAENRLQTLRRDNALKGRLLTSMGNIRDPGGMSSDRKPVNTFFGLWTPRKRNGILRELLPADNACQWAINMKHSTTNQTLTPPVRGGGLWDGGEEEARRLTQFLNEFTWPLYTGK